MQSGPPDVLDTFDTAVRSYLTGHPQATVVALGEGLGTGFWRLDNGRLTWLTVLPPRIAAVRRMLFPDGPRRRTVARAVTDHGWLDAVRDPDLGVIVTAPGVLRRLRPAAVHALLTACAERFPGGALVFDAPPRRVPAAGGRPGIAAVRVLGPTQPGRRLPGVRALVPLVCEVRFARGSGRSRTGRTGAQAVGGWVCGP